MRKLFFLSCLLIAGALTGCSAATVKQSYSLTTEYDSYTMEESIILHGTDDDTLDKSEELVTITFDGSQTSMDEKEAFKYALTTFVPDSKYITLNYSETESTLIVTTVTDYKQAMSDKAAVYADEVYSAKEYYSIEKTANAYIEDGYKLEEEAK